MRNLRTEELQLGAIALAGMALANRNDVHAHQIQGAYGSFREALNRVFTIAYGENLGNKLAADFVWCWDGNHSEVFLADWLADKINEMAARRNIEP